MEGLWDLALWGFWGLIRVYGFRDLGLRVRPSCSSFPVFERVRSLPRQPKRLLANARNRP